MNAKQNRRTVHVIGIWGIVLTMGITVPFVMAGSDPSKDSRGGQKDQVTQNGLKDLTPTTQPGLPPLNDSEMVIQPDSPPDPDAVVIPPVLDTEMAVDPATRQPMTEEKLDRITPEGLEDNRSSEEQREFQKK